MPLGILRYTDITTTTWRLREERASERQLSPVQLLRGTAVPSPTDEVGYLLTGIPTAFYFLLALQTSTDLTVQRPARPGAQPKSGHTLRREVASAVSSAQPGRAAHRAGHPKHTPRRCLIYHLMLCSESAEPSRVHRGLHAYGLPPLHGDLGRLGRTANPALPAEEPFLASGNEGGWARAARDRVGGSPVHRDQFVPILGTLALPIAQGKGGSSSGIQHECTAAQYTERSTRRATALGRCQAFCQPVSPTRVRATACASIVRCRKRPRSRPRRIPVLAASRPSSPAVPACPAALSLGGCHLMPPFVSRTDWDIGWGTRCSMDTLPDTCSANSPLSSTLQLLRTPPSSRSGTSRSLPLRDC